MKLYKVIFENNKAVSSQEVDLSNKVTVEMDRTNGARIKWIIIFASGKEGSIATANEMATFFIEKKAVA